MPSDKKQELPATPTYQQDPLYRQTVQKITDLGNRITGYDFTGDLSPLADTISYNPETTKLFLDTLTKSLTPAFNRSVTDMKGILAQNNQLESSVLPDKLGSMNSDFYNTLAVQTGQFGLQDTARALENRIRLQQIGGNYLNQGAQFGQANEQNLNQFNLSNYENQVAKYQYEQQNQGGGWLGALTGGLGGAMTGWAMSGGNPMGALAGGVAGGASGYFSPMNSSTGGGTFLKGGLTTAPMAMMNKQTGMPSYYAGSSASNNLFRDTGNYGAGLNSQAYLQSLYGGLA